MQNQIDTLRQLNYELIKNLGLFRQRAGLSFGQRHTLYHINAHHCLFRNWQSFYRWITPR